jgi:hypothetical protein
MALAERALGRLAHRGEGLGEDVVEGLAIGQALLQRGRARPEVLIGQRNDARLSRIDLIDNGLDFPDIPIVRGAERSPDYGADHQDLKLVAGRESQSPR